ncbi:response regulator transcription factor [Candidatus Peregrinibacteria bacterium]|nr:response regulator transcription factor [Candidatus Peregrinibacteria bacterium]
MTKKIMDILVVEDEKLTADMVRSIILTLPSVRHVDLSRDYQDALEKFSGKTYHMALIDIGLANKTRNGLDLCRAIREKNPHIPLIMLTADTSFESLKKAFDATVNDYIKKPFFAQELLLRVQRWLPTQESRHPEPIEYHTLSYHGHNNEFYCEGQKIPLTKKNKTLLLLFLQHREKILAPDFLEERLWGDYDPLGNKRNVRSNIQILRLALKKAQCDRWIITVRGEGYMLKKDPSQTP